MRLAETAQRKLQHQRLPMFQIIKRAIAIIIGAVLMATGLEIFLILGY